MNGRIYDPVIAKMISPDPTVPFPDNLQAFNRYSYVMNRPLSLTDPSGFTPKSTSGFKEQARAVMKSLRSKAISSSGLSTRDQIGSGKRTTEYKSESQFYIDGGGSIQSYTQNCDSMGQGEAKYRSSDVAKPQKQKEAENRTEQQKTADGYINLLENSDWGATEEGKKIIKILKTLNENNKITLTHVVSKDKDAKTKYDGYFDHETASIKMIVTLSPSDYKSLMKEIEKAKNGEIDITVSGVVSSKIAGLYAHEGYHVLDQLQGGGQQDGYGFDDERGAYDVGYRASTAVFNDFFNGSRQARSFIQPRTSEWIKKEYRDRFDKKDDN